MIHTSTQPTTSVVQQEGKGRNSLFLSSGLLCGLGDFAGLFSLFDALDDTYCNGLTHITDSESTERRIIGESFDTHWLGGNHLDDSSVTRLDEFGRVFDPKVCKYYSR